jgi:hypothetical protein
MKEQMREGVSPSSKDGKNIPSLSIGRTVRGAASIAAREGSMPITDLNP